LERFFTCFKDEYTLNRKCLTFWQEV